MTLARDAVAWIFQESPKIFDGKASALDQPLGRMRWLVTNSRDHILPGQPALIWRSGSKGGFVALGLIEAKPESDVVAEDDLVHWTEAKVGELSTTARWWVEVNIRKRLNPAKYNRERLRGHLVLRDQRPICPVHVGSNFPVNRECLTALRTLLK